MAKYEWFAWSSHYREDDWFLSLSTGQRWAWVAFLSYANESDFSVNKMSTETLSRRVEADPQELTTLLQSAIANGKIQNNDTHWIVTNGKRYRPDITNTERQAKFRQKVTARNDASQPVTEHNDRVTPVTDIQDRTEQDRRNPPTPLTGSSDNTNLLVNSFLTDFRKLCDEFPAIPKPRKLSPERYKKLATQLLSGKFNTTEVLQDIQDSKWHHGDNPKNWAIPHLDWILSPGNRERLHEAAEKDRKLNYLNQEQQEKIEPILDPRKNRHYIPEHKPENNGNIITTRKYLSDEEELALRQQQGDHWWKP